MKIKTAMILCIIMIFLTGCFPRTLSDPPAPQSGTDKLIILKRVGTENKHDRHKEITDKKLVQSIHSKLVNIEDWEQVKLEMDRAPDYKLYFEPTDGRDAKNVLYDVWFNNEVAEIYIEASNSYKKLSKEDSAILKLIQ